MNMKNHSFLIFLSFLLSSCAVQHHPAPIEYNHSGKILKSNALQLIDNAHIEKQDEKNPNQEYLPNDLNNESGTYKILYHQVQLGEDINQIASLYNQTVEEIVTFNKLYPPYQLEEFQTIKIKFLNYDKNSTIKELETALEDLEEPKKLEVKLQPPKDEFINPLEGKIISKFGENTVYGINKGINISAVQGASISSSTSGKVIYSDYDAIFGNLILIKSNGKNIISSYAHLEKSLVKKGESVDQGDVIGYVGKSGKVNKPQLNFGIREGKKAKDPLKFIRR